MPKWLSVVLRGLGWFFSAMCFLFSALLFSDSVLGSVLAALAGGVCLPPVVDRAQELREQKKKKACPRMMYPLAAFPVLFVALLVGVGGKQNSAQTKAGTQTELAQQTEKTTAAEPDQTRPQEPEPIEPTLKASTEQLLDKRLADVRAHYMLKDKKAALQDWMELKGIDPKHETEFYNCLSEHIHRKGDDLKVREVIGWCEREFMLGKGKFTKAHYNLDNIEFQFSAWDGSHRESEKLIKMTLKDPDSYKHLSTRYMLILSGEDAPCIQVATMFTATNSFGGRVRGRHVVQANIYTGEILRVLE